MEGDWQIFIDVCLKDKDSCDGNNLIDSSSYFFEIDRDHYLVQERNRLRNEKNFNQSP